MSASNKDSRWKYANRYLPSRKDTDKRISQQQQQISDTEERVRYLEEQLIYQRSSLLQENATQPLSSTRKPNDKWSAYLCSIKEAKLGDESKIARELNNIQKELGLNLPWREVKNLAHKDLTTHNQSFCLNYKLYQSFQSPSDLQSFIGGVGYCKLRTSLVPRQNYFQIIITIVVLVRLVTMTSKSY